MIKFVAAIGNQPAVPACLFAAFAVSAKTFREL
jgi:hypothetical protein